ncbi:hypothetical protein HF526_34170 [Pseudonocardia sp. K10HN5]|uniref:Integral membrane protein n=1 Tax=Pseudonocardia acidicola TaxID=2724939 RepID=A0ABX1SNA7_9PSEU|nr:hypothetical protein [Pseudonocardia acidicola]
MPGDIWVWLTFALLLAVMGARAWVVETGQGRLGRTPVKVQVLTGAVGVVVVGLVVLLTVDGGATLVNMLLNPSNTSTTAPADPAAPGN